MKNEFQQLFSDLRVSKEREIYQVYPRFTVFNVYLVKKNKNGELVKKEFVYRETERNR